MPLSAQLPGTRLDTTCEKPHLGESMTEHSAKQSAGSNRVFRWAAMLFAAAVTLHATDHLRPGMDILPPAVMVAGMV